MPPHKRRIRASLPPTPTPMTPDAARRCASAADCIISTRAMQISAPAHRFAAAPSAANAALRAAFAACRRQADLQCRAAARTRRFSAACRRPKAAGLAVPPRGTDLQPAAGGRTRPQGACTPRSGQTHPTPSTASPALSLNAGQTQTPTQSAAPAPPPAKHSPPAKHPPPHGAGIRPTPGQATPHPRPQSQ